MNPNRLAARAVVAALLVAAAPIARAQAKPRVAVIEFKNKAEGYAWSWYNCGRAAQDMLVTELVKSQKFRVVEREQLAAILQEKNLTLSGDVDPKTAVKIGKMLGVEYLISGAVTEMALRKSGVNVPGGLPFMRGPSVNVKSSRLDVGLDARAINTSTGEIAWADTAKKSVSDSSVFVAGAGGGSEDERKLDRALRPAVETLARSLAGQGLSTSGVGGANDASGVAGKIAKVDGATVFVNVGSEAGIKEGAEFDVYRVGEVIKDPDTGEVLGQNETKVGRVRIEAVRGPRLSTARVVSGSGFRAGDAIKN